MKDLGQTKESLQLAQKAYFEKDPQAIEYLQLDSEEGQGEQIILMDGTEEASAVQVNSEDQLGAGPLENEEEMAVLTESS
mmetsp:Transcript_39319/g.60083  ORF Transcript_39319/g.60083 Transcript_39319/m.60083 type:complete len:80 (+) Transcript_39319:4337-4576(+)